MIVLTGVYICLELESITLLEVHNDGLILLQRFRVENLLQKDRGVWRRAPALQPCALYPSL
jgi:hypothetical protein